jgi:hypothetical protein
MQRSLFKNVNTLTKYTGTLHPVNKTMQRRAGRNHLIR